ncbi:MAG: alpha/beta fold hydrolase [Gemmatimonadales bacterium]|nr:alpha/beta fold hydrolase [Gemmatimonadales bacterium]
MGEPRVADAERHVRGVTLFERRVGEGPPVVVLHGGPGASHDYLRPGLDVLAEGRTLVYYDQRGGGRSAVGRDVAAGWAEQVADLEALREAWGLEQLALLGYSWGGLLALLYWLAHPARVARLALLAPAPAWRTARDAFEARFAERSLAPALQAARAELRASGLRERDLAAYQQRLFELAVAGYFHDPARARDLVPFRVVERVQKAVWEGLGDFDLRPALAEAAARHPVAARVVHGEDDPIPLESARAVAGLLGAPLVAIPACGHVPYVEAPDAVRAALDPFLPRHA